MTTKPEANGGKFVAANGKTYDRPANVQEIPDYLLNRNPDPSKDNNRARRLAAFLDRNGIRAPFVTLRAEAERRGFKL